MLHRRAQSPLELATIGAVRNDAAAQPCRRQQSMGREQQLDLRHFNGVRRVAASGDIERVMRLAAAPAVIDRAISE